MIKRWNSSTKLEPSNQEVHALMQRPRRYYKDRSSGNPHVRRSQLRRQSDVDDRRQSPKPTPRCIPDLRSLLASVRLQATLAAPIVRPRANLAKAKEETRLEDRPTHRANFTEFTDRKKCDNGDAVKYPRDQWVTSCNRTTLPSQIPNGVKMSKSDDVFNFSEQAYWEARLRQGNRCAGCSDDLSDLPRDFAPGHHAGITKQEAAYFGMHDNPDWVRSSENCDVLCPECHNMAHDGGRFRTRIDSSDLYQLYPDDPIATETLFQKRQAALENVEAAHSASQERLDQSTQLDSKQKFTTSYRDFINSIQQVHQQQKEKTEKKVETPQHEHKHKL